MGVAADFCFGREDFISEVAVDGELGDASRVYLEHFEIFLQCWTNVLLTEKRELNDIVSKHKKMHTALLALEKKASKDPSKRGELETARLVPKFL